MALNRTSTVAVIVAAIFGGLYALDHLPHEPGRTTETAPVVKATAAPIATPYPVISDDLKAAVSRFYRDLGNVSPNALDRDTSPDFQRAYSPRRFVNEYAGQIPLDIHTDDVRGRTVDLTVRFITRASDHASAIITQRKGSWTLVHGAAGWLLDHASWGSSILVAFQDPAGRRWPVSNLRRSGEQVTFEADGATWRLSFGNDLHAGFTIAKDAADPWAALAERSPQVVSTLPPGYRIVAPRTVVTKPASSGTNDCVTESIATRSDDGAFIGTLAGGQYIVEEVDRVDTALWLVTDDVTVCDDGAAVQLIHEGEIAHARRHT